MNLRPARLEPIFEPRPWGARSLAPLFPEKCGLPEPIGEAWLTARESRFLSGSFAGRKLADAWPSMEEEWTGTSATRHSAFPLLVKFLFPTEKLSIQVHPPDEYAQRYESAAGGTGKTEMWYVVDAQPGAELLVGLKPDIRPDDCHRAIVKGTFEECLERVDVRTGDAIFVPAGTVHTIGPGMILCEIQEYSDLTYRIFDYHRVGLDGRPRPLHIEKALDVISFGEPSGGKLEPVHIRRGPVAETYFIACRYFAVEKWEVAERVAAATSPEHFDLLIVLEGRGHFQWAGEREAYETAQAWFLPAGLGAYRLEPERPTAFLRAYVPVSLEEFAQRLADQRVPESAWSRLIYP